MGDAKPGPFRLSFKVTTDLLPPGLFFVFVLTFLGSSVADAMLPPEVYEQARKTAEYHLQVRVLRVTAPPTTPGECAVTGEVVRIFRDKSATLTSGTTLGFRVSCSKQGDTIPIAGTVWTNHDQLMGARYLEVFLNRKDGRYELALWQCRIIEAPTEHPTFGSTKTKEGSQ